MSPQGGTGRARPIAQRWRLAALLVPLLIGAGLVERAPRLAADAIGCSRVDDSYPGSDGTCTYRPSQACYNCEYSTGGGYEVCAENVDGTIRICTTVEELPGRHPSNQQS